jgi:hypothetical protein
MPDPAQNTQLNKELRLHAAAVLYFLSRLAITVFVFAVPVLYFTLGVVELPYVIGGAVLVAALFLGYYLAAAGLRCAACGSPVLMDNGNRKHPHAARFPGLNPRARVAWDILFSSSYQCMYCVTRCRCKKSWGGKGKTKRPTSYQAPVGSPARETFPGSIFGDVGAPVADGEPSFPSPPREAVEAPQRVVSGTFAAAAVFPNAQTVPVSLVAPFTAPIPPLAPAAAPDVIVDAAAPVPAPVFPTDRTISAPVPWSIPVLDSPTPVTEPSMNQPFPDPQAAANPFLAAAASMPPPLVPPPPSIPPAQSRPQPEPGQSFHSEFPYAPVATPADGPPPWTIPSMPAEKCTVPVAPPVSAVAPAPQRPLPTPALASEEINPGNPPPSVALPHAQVLRDVVNVLQEGQRTLADAFESLIGRLESHFTTLSRVPAPAPPPDPKFVTAAIPPAPPVLPVVPPPAPSVVSNGPELPHLLTQMRPPAAIPPQVRSLGKTTLVPLPVLPPVFPPAPALAPAQSPAETIQPFLPPLPASPPVSPAAPAFASGVIPPPEPMSGPQVPSPFAAYTPAPAFPPAPPAPAPASVPVDPAPVPPAASPMPFPAPVSPSSPASAEPGPRRRFARPSPATAQELNQVLQEAFAPAPAPAPPSVPPPAAPVAHPSVPAWQQTPAYAVPGSNGHHAPPQAPPAPAASAVPASARQTAPQHPFTPPVSSSPFAIADTPLYAPPGAPQEPAPFTFLKNEDGHFSPAPPSGDPLEEGIMPWMQPVGPGHTRN